MYCINIGLFMNTSCYFSLLAFEVTTPMMANSRKYLVLSLVFVLTTSVFAWDNVLAEELQQQQLDYNFTLNDYIHSKQRREIAAEFFNYYKNFSDDVLREARIKISISDLKCMADLTQISQAMASGSLWAWKFLDAWGSLPAGLLYGNTEDLGNFDECIGIKKEVLNTALTGKYCLSKLPIGNSLGTVGSLLSNIQFGACMPASCSATTMDTLIKRFLGTLLNVSFSKDTTLIRESTCKTSEPAPLSTTAIATIVILSILGGLMLLATLYDYFLTKDDKMHPVIRAFSARANARTLFRVSDQSKNPNVVPCLHGMRCMSLIWVIYGHCFMIAVSLPNMNMIHLYKWIPSPFAMLVQYGTYAVDTFFFLSGLLLVMLAMRDMDKNSGKLNVPLMYLHRYLRLTPMLAIAIMAYSSLFKHMGDGPLWGATGFDSYKACKKHWWETLLYIQNYATDSICLVHSWYLSVDTELYFISPLLLIPLWKWGKKGVAGIVVLMLLLASCLFSMMMIKNYSIFQMNMSPPPNSTIKIYYATHTRASPWLIGLILGYYLHKTKGKQIKLSKIVVWLGWICSLALLFTCIYALYGKMQWRSSKLTKLEDASFTTLSRIAWPLGLSWIVFACVKGYGGLANSFLSSPLWQPLSKVSYSAYIWHLFIMNINAGLVRSNTYFSDYALMLRFWPDFGMSILLAVLMYLVIEAPLAGLEMLLLPNRRSSPKDMPVVQKPETTTAPVESGAPISTTLASIQVPSNDIESDTQTNVVIDNLQAASSVDFDKKQPLTN